MRMNEVEIIELDGKKVPVKISKETVCTGKIEVSGDVMTAEDIRERIIGLANQSGNYSGDGSDLDISYDVDGNYTVAKVTKTPLSYEEALEVYQKSLDIEEELRDQFGGLAKGTPQEEYDKLRGKLSEQQDATEVYAQRVEDAYNELHQQEAMDIGAYYERYGLTDVSSVDEIADKLDEAVAKGLITREGADNVFESLARIREIRDEIEDLRQAKRDNIDRKKLLVEEDGAKADNVRGYDEAVRQIDERIRELEDELNSRITTLPPVTVERLSEEVVEEQKENKSEEVAVQPTEPTVTNRFEDEMFGSLSYEEALEAYQKSLDKEQELRDAFGGLPKGTPQEEYDRLRKELADQQARTEVLAQRVEDAYNELHQQEKMDIDAYYARYGLTDESTVDDIAAKLDEAVEKGLITREGADQVFESLAFIKELRDEIEELRNSRKENVDRKRLLIEKDGAKEDSVRGYDEAVRQIDDKIRELEDRLNSTITTLPPVTVERLTEEVVEERTNNEPDNGVQEQVAEDTQDDVIIEDKPQGRQLPAVIKQQGKQVPAVIDPRADAIRKLAEGMMSQEQPSEIAEDEAIVEDKPQERQLPAVIDPKVDAIRRLAEGMMSQEQPSKDKPEETTTTDTTPEEDYQELVELREKLDRVNDNKERLRLLRELVEKTEKLESSLLRESNLDEFRKAIQSMDDQIREIEKELRQAISEYEQSYENLRNIMIEQNRALNGDEPLSDEDYRRLTDEYIARKMQENAHSDYVRRTIDEYKKQLASLKRRKNALERDLKEAAALGLSATEFREINDVMRKRKLIKEILERKGLGEIVDIPAKDRTKEQQRQLNEARDEIRRELGRHQAEVEEEVSVLDSIEILYGVDPRVVQVRKPRKTTMSKDEIERIKEAAEKASVVKITNPDGTTKDNNNKEALKGPEDMLEVHQGALNNEERRGLIDRITIFTDVNTGKKYTRKYVFTRFNIIPQSEEVRINGSVCYELFEDDLNYILNNANNEISPYEVVTMDFDIEKQKQLIKQHEKNVDDINKKDFNKFTGNNDDLINKITEQLRGITDKMGQDEDIEDYSFVKPQERGKVTLYYDLDNNEIYANEDVFARFNLEELGDAVIIDGAPCFRMTQENALYIDDNKDNEVAPYDLEVRNVHLGLRHEEEKTTEDEEVVEDTQTREKEHDNELDSRPGLTDKFTLFRDLDNDGLIYVRKNVLTRFNIMEAGVDVRINGAVCYPISDEDADYIRRNQDNDYSPYIVEEVDVHLGQKGLVPVDPKKDEIIPVEKREILIYVDKNDNDQLYTSEEVLDAFAIGYEGEPTVIEGVNTHKIDAGTNAFLNGFAESSVNPKYEVVYKEITLTKEIPHDKEIVLTLYRDLNDNNQLYASTDIINRFGINLTDKRTRNILGEPCHRISPEIDHVINGLAAEAENPKIRIEYRDVKLRKNKKKPKPEKEEEITLTLFRDLDDNNQLYASLEILDRFHIIPMDKTVFQVEGLDCNKISPEVDFMINSLAKEAHNPKIKIAYKDVHLKKREVEEEITLTIFRDINDNGQLYASDEILNRFGITLKDKATTNILGHNCHKISADIDRVINQLAREARNPKIKIEYLDVKLKKKQEERKHKPHLEEILFKLTDGLDIRSRDAKKYQARNIKVGKQFADELHSGNYLYNIVHLVPATIKLLFSGSRKIFNSIFTTGRGRKVMAELAKRINALTDEELEILFTEYRGSVLKTDMNNQINPLILGRLKEYGMRKVQKLNALIGQNYEEMFAYLSQIKAIDEQLRKGHIGEAERQALETTRADLLHKSSTNVKNILKARKEANELLSGGIHGLEEDFKAVATKLSYVGMRFAKTNDFDNELQQQLAGFGRQLNDGLDTGNDQDIVDGFVGMERTFAENTQFGRGLRGGFSKKSVGQKYYTPLAEVLDYRDDPFIRDLFTTVAVTTAVVSAVNAIRVHQIKQGQYVDAKNQEIADANNVNAQTAANVRQQGQTITDYGDTYRQGMAAQQRQDVLATANTSERASLDLTGWKFNDAYHAADDASHAAYNQFGDQVVQRANDIATRYGQGVIDQPAALREMAQLSADSQATLVDVVNSSLPILRQYAATHPQFDLHAVEEAMSYISAHPDAIANMNDATLDIMEIGEALQGVTATQVSALGALPSDMATTIIAAATSAAMAGRICATMEDGMRKGKYGNKVTDMMDEYIESQEEVEEEEHQRTR